jgi:hypothetical protein
MLEPKALFKTPGRDWTIQIRNYGEDSQLRRRRFNAGGLGCVLVTLAAQQFAILDMGLVTSLDETG